MSWRFDYSSPAKAETPVIEQFHFLRPAWLLALLPLAWLLWHCFRQHQNRHHWRSIIDAALLPYLLQGGIMTKRHHLWKLIAISSLLVIIALAGPVWERLPQPVFNQQTALVIALDLSRSMDVGDIKPSRLARARHKINDILLQRKTGQTALVSYAADAFIVTPLTNDSDTIVALLSNLSTEIMPVQGSRADKALLQAAMLLENAGVPHGDVLLVSDGFNEREMLALQAVLPKNTHLRVSILAVGTAEGAPIPLREGGFLKDAMGSIVIPRLNESAMRQIAALGGGYFHTISPTDADITALLEVMQVSRFAGGTEAEHLQADTWREQGPWLILLVIPLVALLFRRGVVFLLPLILLPLPPDAGAINWDGLWKNSDQRGSEAFQKKDYQTATELFQNPEWQASSLYQSGDYEQALQYWLNQNGADAHYNRGNALAKLGRLEQAIAAYDQALQKRPDDEDTIFNKKQVEAQLNQQQSAQNQQDQPQPSTPNDKQTGNTDRDEKTDSRKDDQADQEQTPTQAEVQQDLEQQMLDQAGEQWLRKIPDDPGGLLRRKFRYQYQQRGRDSNVQEAW